MKNVSFKTETGKKIGGAVSIVLALALCLNLFAAYAIGAQGLFSVSAAGYAYPPQGDAYVPNVADGSIEGAWGETFVYAGGNFDFETVPSSAWTITPSSGAFYHSKTEDGSTLAHKKMSTTMYDRSHLLFQPAIAGNSEYSEPGTDNGNYILHVTPHAAGNSVVTVTQNLAGFDPQYVYRIGVLVKTIGIGEAYFMAGAPGITEQTASDDQIAYINSNLGTFGNGLYGSSFTFDPYKMTGETITNEEYRTFVNENLDESYLVGYPDNAKYEQVDGKEVEIYAYWGDYFREWQSQYWHYTTVYTQPDANGNITLTLSAYTDADTDAQNMLDYYNYYQLFADNVDICVYKAPTADSMDIDVKYYDFSYLSDDMARFFEFSWAQNAHGGHDGIDSGLISGVLDDDGNMTFVEGASMDAYNVETYTELSDERKALFLSHSADRPTVYDENGNYVSGSRPITADLLNGNVAGIDGLFRGEYIEDTITFYDQNGAFVYDSRYVGHTHECATHGNFWNRVDADGNLNRLGGIFPFCDSCRDAEGLNHNYHFGMTMEVPFYVDYESRANDNYKISFLGDDDFWLFIDGVCIINAGGAHRPLDEASIDLKTNDVVVYEIDQQDEGKPTISGSIYSLALQSLQSAYGNDTAAINEKLVKLFGTSEGLSDESQLTDGYHTFKIFYMERCTDASDLGLTLDLGLEDIKSEKVGYVLDDNGELTESEYVRVGDTIEYHLDVINIGDATYNPIYVTDVMPKGLELDTAYGVTAAFIKNGAVTGTVPTDGYSLTITDSGFDGVITRSMQENERIRFTFRAKVTDDAVDLLSVTNTARVRETEVTSSSILIAPKLEVQKTVVNKETSYLPGDLVNYQVVFSNPSLTDLENIAISDTCASGIIWPQTLPEGFGRDASGGIYIPKLEAGKSLKITYGYTLTTADYEAASENGGKFVNTVTGSAVYHGKDITAQSSADVPFGTAQPHLKLIKQVCSTSGGTYSDSIIAKPGDTVYFKYTLVNDGNVPLTNAVVTDEMVGSETGGYVVFTAPSLAVGDEITSAPIPYVISGTADPKITLDKYADAEAWFGSKNVTDRDNAWIDLIDFTVEKTADVTEAAVGDTISYTITITNTGSADLADIEVTDSLPVIYNGKTVAAGEAITTVSLEAGANSSTSIEVGYTVTEDDVRLSSKTNIAYARVADPADPTKSVERRDDVTVTLTPPTAQLIVHKEVSLTGNDNDWHEVISARPGDTVYYRVYVENASDVSIENIIVNDDINDLDHDVPYLAPGDDTEEDAKVTTVTIPGDADVTKVIASSATATATATYNGETLTSTDTANVNLYSIALTKTAVGDGAAVGDDAHFTITVANTGKATLENIKVTDTLDVYYQGVLYPAGSVITTIAELKPTDSPVVLDVYYPVTIADFAGTAINNRADAVSVVYENDDTDEVRTVSSNDDASLPLTGTAYSPITISKSAAPTQVSPGGSVQFTITVTNTGKAAYTDLFVHDPYLGKVWKIDTLAPYGSTNFTYTAPAADCLYNVAPNAAPGTYTNTAYLDTDETLDTSDPDSYIDKSSADYTVLNDPKLSMTKEAQISVANRGTVVPFRITVKNDGNCRISNIDITDIYDVVFDDAAVEAGDAITTIPYLDPKESALFTVYYTVPANAAIGESITNTANAAGSDPDGKPVTDTAQGDIPVIAGAAPTLDVVKTADCENALPGETVTFTVTVTNNGTAPLTGIEVSDVLTASGFEGELAKPAAWDEEFASLIASGVAPGEDWTGEFEYVIPAAIGDERVVSGTVFNNAVTVTAFNPNAADPDDPSQRLSASDDDDVTVTKTFVPTISKSVSRETAEPGTEVVYTIIVRNEGNSVIEKAYVTDSMLETAGFLPNDHESWPVEITNLAPDDAYTISVNYVIPYDAEIGSRIHNTATVTAQNPDYPDDRTRDITVSDDADVDVVDKIAETDELVLTKTVDKSYADPGETVVFTLSVYNNSDIVWRNLVLYDPMLDDYVAECAKLEPGKSWSITSEDTDFFIPETAKAGDVFTNTVYLFKARQFNEDDPDLEKALADADATVTTNIVTDLEISKSANVTSAQPGDEIVYTIMVSNTGNCDLENVMVTDILDGAWVLDEQDETVTLNEDGSVTIASLPAGELIGKTLTYVSTVPETAISGEVITNTAVATAPNPDPDSEELTISDSDDAVTTVVIPGIDIVKTANVDSVYPGEDVTFVITVTNIGDTVLENIDVTDDMELYYEGELVPAGDVLTTIGSLDPGKSVTLEVVHKVPETAAAGSTVSGTAHAEADNGCEDYDDDGVTVLEIPEEPEEPTADFTIVKTPNVTEVKQGGEVEYTIIVTNTGDTELTDIEITDSLPVEYNGTVYQPGEVITTVPTLEPGKVTTLKVVYTVPEDAQTGKLPASAYADPSELDKKDASCDVTVVESDRPAYEFRKVSDVESATPGTRINYYVTVTNTGNCVIENITVADDKVGYSVTIDSLAPGEVWRSAEGALYYDVPLDPAASFENTATIYSEVLGSSASNTVSVDTPSGVQGDIYGSPSTGTQNNTAAIVAVSVLTAILGASAVVVFVIMKRRRNAVTAA